MAHTLEKFDEVKPFPVLLAAPKKDPGLSKTSRHTAGRKLKTQKSLPLKVNTESNALPGILKASKTQVLPAQMKMTPTAAAGSVFVGFNASNIHLDSVKPQVKSSTEDILSKSLNQVNLNTQAAIPKKQDESLNALRSYTSLMDEFSLHNFMIWNGSALKDTPEFQSYQRTYKNQWSYINSVIFQLEKLMTDNFVKLAIVSGVKVAEYAILNLPQLQPHELLDCVCNADQIRPQLNSFAGDSQDHILRAAIKIQTLGRRWFAMYRFRSLKRRLTAAITIQSIIRRFVQRCKAHTLLQNLAAVAEERWKANMKALMEDWRRPTPSSNKKIIVHIPSVSASEFFRVNMSHLASIQNSVISFLYQLADPRVEIVYISPCHLGPTERNYFEKFLALMDISILPNRLKFIVPELSAQLPDSVPVAQALWYSSSTLKKLRSIISFHHGDVVIIPGDLGWAEKRIASYLGVKMLSPEPIVAHEMTSRSQSKRLFMEANMNIPIGAHDIYSEEDMLISLTRLMASNLDINRWLIRLNVDYNGEGTAYVDAGSLPIIQALKQEQTALMNTSIDPDCWFERHVQLNARKRILAVFQETDMGIVKICRDDMFPNWKVFMRFVAEVGAVVEAEPLGSQGRIESYCFVDPCGGLHISKGSVVVVDECYQRQSVVHPQNIIHERSLEGATQAIVSKLYDVYGVMGYVTVSFSAFWDAYDHTPRIWANGIRFGMNSSFGAFQTLGLLIRPFDSELLKRPCLVPLPTDGRHCVHIPSAIHTPLSDSRDDVFFRLCKMHGIAYDPERKSGVLFFLVDSIIGGTLSMLAVADTKLKALECAVQALTFISRNFGKCDRRDLVNDW
eukprot:CAMPEP_0185032016 /NCGR_PEP_ID=MMETSP1103-20130426/19829_1 /TAXON_ID=36769 /ORGANISM="Paraphysomonas bandaiensis, Strain Caron Lab Isolate" /LENGTH=845 /DNA_ID=CAMNT_0027567749 /DNA_START=65 /DNA_END=2599 /DNA_ORIENTATION=-